MTPTIDEVLGRLEREDAVAIGARERVAGVLATERPSLPWYARGFTGFYGWVAAGFFIAFAWWCRWSDVQEIAFGLLAVGAGIGLRHLAKRGYLAHLSLSLALAGEVCAVWGMSRATGHHTLTTPLFMLGVELLLFFAYPDSLMRLLCTLGSCSALFRIREHHLPVTFDVLVLGALAGALLLFHFRPRLERTRFARMVAPAAYGLAVSACGWMLSTLDKWSRLSLDWPARIGVAVLLLAQLAVMLKQRRSVAIAALFVVALAALSFGAPGVLAGVALLAAALHRREQKLVGFAAVFLVFFYSHLYYSMNETLLVKSALMLGNGLCFVLLWQLLGGQRVESAPVTLDRRIMAMALAGALLVVNALIVQKERVLDTGQPVLVELRPVDPRSLMQGDYMTLRYRIADRWDSHPRERDGRMVVKLDANGVADFVRWDDGTALQAGERLLRYRDRGGAVRLGAEAFFFEEGKGDLYAGARYGELRVTKKGDAVLVGLRDRERNRLGRALR